MPPTPYVLVRTVCLLTVFITGRALMECETCRQGAATVGTALYIAAALLIVYATLFKRDL